MSASARDQILARRFDLLFDMIEAICKAMEAPPGQAGLRPQTPASLAALAPAEAQAAGEITRGAFPPETVRLLLRETTRTPTPGGPALAPVDLDVVARRFSPVLEKLGPEHIPVVMEVVGNVGHEGLRRVLLGYLERALPGHEAGVVDAVMTLELDAARAILRMFSTSRTQGALEALRRLAGCAIAGIRCEAIAQLAAGPEQVKDELLQLAEAAAPELRVAALRTLAHHQVRAAGPLLVRRIQDGSFHQLALDERREMLNALYALNPARGEAIAVEAIQRHGLLVDEAAEGTRTLAAEILGREARSQEALEATLAAAKRRPWNSHDLRDAANAAAEAIAARLGKRILPSGDVQ
jgi:hypothetical protein